MPMIDYYIKDLPSFLEEVNKLKHGETWEYGPNDDHATRVSLHALNTGERTEVRVRFIEGNEECCESACILADIKADTGKAAKKIEGLARDWYNSVSPDHMEDRDPEVFLKSLGEGARYYDPANYEVEVPFDMERELCGDEWSKNEAGEFEYIEGEHRLGEVKLVFDQDEWHFECTHDNSDLLIDIKYVEVFDLDKAGDIEVAATKFARDWETGCAGYEQERELEEIDRQLDFYEDERPYKVRRLTSLREAHAGAVVKKNASLMKHLDKSIKDIVSEVEFIDEYVREHHLDPDAFIKEFGGVLPEAKPNKKAAGKGVSNDVGLA